MKKLVLSSAVLALASSLMLFSVSASACLDPLGCESSDTCYCQSERGAEKDKKSEEAESLINRFIRVFIKDAE